MEWALGIGEGVELAGVDDRVEGPAGLGQGEGVVDEECRGTPSFLRLLSRLLDRRRGRRHAPDHVARGREEEGVLPGPAADVEHVTDEFSRLLVSNERSLWPPGVPRWSAAMGLLEENHRTWGIVGGDEDGSLLRS